MKLPPKERKIPLKRKITKLRRFYTTFSKNSIIFKGNTTKLKKPPLTLKIYLLKLEEKHSTQRELKKKKATVESE